MTSSVRAAVVRTTDSTERPRPPAWLVLSTIGLALASLRMAVTETSFWGHYLIDQGEVVSLIGLAFISIAGWVLYRERRLLVSLPFVFPWLLYPVITQGDQIIDNLSINPMRAISHVLLGLLFGLPIGVIVLATRYVLAPRPGHTAVAPAWTALFPGLRPIAEGRTREGAALFAAALLVLEMWVAHVYLGTLMVITLIVMLLGVLLQLSSVFSAGRIFAGLARQGAEGAVADRARSERFALVVVGIGVLVSFGLYIGYKNRPGAYQGSPAFLMDPAQKALAYPLDRIAVSSRAPSLPAPSTVDAVRQALVGYARSINDLIGGYYILDRNYTYDFHNELFLRHWPLVPKYRAVGLQKVAEARHVARQTDPVATNARASLADDDPLAALLDETRAFTTYAFDRSPILERMSGEFERTPAGLQHAAHLYEGEGKALSLRMSDILAKHRATIDSPELTPVTGEFAPLIRDVYQAYANRVVGF